MRADARPPRTPHPRPRTPRPRTRPDGSEEEAAGTVREADLVFRVCEGKRPSRVLTLRGRSGSGPASAPHHVLRDAPLPDPVCGEAAPDRRTHRPAESPSRTGSQGAPPAGLGSRGCGLGRQERRPREDRGRGGRRTRGRRTRPEPGRGPGRRGRFRGEGEGRRGGREPPGKENGETNRK